MMLLRSMLRPLASTTLRFTAGQVTAMNAVQPGAAYGLRVFEKNYEESTKGCVLLGEVHGEVPTWLESQLAREFSLRGSEGYKARSIGGFLMDGVVNLISGAPFWGSKKSATKDQGFVWLEGKEKLRLFDHVTSMSIPATLLGAIVGLVLPVVHADAGFTFLRFFLPWVGIMLGSTYVARLIPRTSPWKRRVDLMYGHYVYSRDEEMADSIEGILRSAEDGAIMMATVGRSHSPGVAAYLRKRHGFTEVAVPPPT